MAGGDVKLLGFWYSPYTIRVMYALNLKGVEYDYVEEDRNNKSELLLKSNPIYQKVPVLIHDGKPICESSVILHYIDEFWANSGSSILPSDPYDRAVARFWATYLDDKWWPYVRNLLKAQTEEEAVEAKLKAFAELPLIEEAFENCSKGKRFFGGDTIGYLDMVLGSFLGWVEAAKELNGTEFLDSAKVPRLATWAENFRSDETVKKVLPGVDRFVEYHRKVFQAAK